MRKRSYRGHRIMLMSEEIRKGDWVASAMVIIGEGQITKQIPIFGRRRATFDSRKQADAYALELAKLWIDGRLWGANGHG